MINLKDYDYPLDESLIAHEPLVPRDSSRLMILDRFNQALCHSVFNQLPQLLTKADVLVLNDTKVIPARLLGKKATGKAVEVLLLKQLSGSSWQSMSFPGLRLDTQLDFAGLKAKVTHRDPNTGQATLEFSQHGQELWAAIMKLGQTPIPPYIHSKLSETHLRSRYQTVYSQEPGSAAAPTAGLHITKPLLKKLTTCGVEIITITHHVGPGTFARLWQENLDSGKLHSETYSISRSSASRLVSAKKAGKRIISVGTTTTRCLESAVQIDKQGLSFLTGPQSTQLFITPPYKFKFVDGLITNFHLPKSSLLMLVAAITSRPQGSHKFTNYKTSLIGKAYQEAIEQKYRFYSFGDAMLII